MRRPRNRILLLTILVVVFWQSLNYFSQNSPCQLAAIEDLCHRWNDGDVEGDWCFHLCKAQKSCEGVTHFGKQLVVRLRGPFGKAIVKGRYARLQEPTNLHLNPTNPNEDFERRVSARISEFQNSAEQSDKLNHQSISSLAITNSQREQFLSLIQQREFIWSFLSSQYRKNSPFPRLRGICGHLYIVEESDVQFDVVTRWPVKDKLTAVLKITELMTDLERRSVQVCDFKWEHFGLVYNRSVRSQQDKTAFVIKLLDLDAVFTKKSLQFTLENYDCETDEDCDFFDCKGACQKGNKNEKATCVASTTDSNMKRFLNLVSPSLFPPQRSLFYDVNDVYLLEYLEKCRTSTCNLTRLRQLLLKTISSLN